MRELYTRAEEQSLLYFIPNYSGVQLDNLITYAIRTCSCELSGDTSNKLSNVNLMIDALNSNGFTFSHYSNVTEFDNVFDTAYNSGESGFSTRDRIVLRMVAGAGLSMKDEIVSGSGITFTYTNDGVPDYTNNLISESGKTTREMLTYCFIVLDKMRSSSNGQSPWTPEAIDYINSTIPDKYSPKLDRTSTNPLGNRSSSAVTWAAKAILIGPAYIAWLAENKWRPDSTWRP